jgi:hypothetical protein
MLVSGATGDKARTKASVSGVVIDRVEQKPTDN